MLKNLEYLQYFKHRLGYNYRQYNYATGIKRTCSLSYTIRNRSV